MISEQRLFRFLAIAIGVAFALFVINAVALFLVWRGSQPYAPMGDYPPPHIALPFESGPHGQAPTVHVHTGDETLPVHATRCNESDVDVPVVGFAEWKPLDPTGRSVDDGRGQSIRKPGCQDLDFRTPVPRELLDRLLQLHRGGTDRTLWQLTGQETPISPDGVRQGVTRLWTSEPFQIVYDMS